MATRKSAAVKSPVAAAAPGSALAQLQSLISPVAPVDPVSPTLAPSEVTDLAAMQDPTIRDAKRLKSTVTLGFDTEFSNRVEHGFNLSSAMKAAKEAFTTIESELREYGKTKRSVFNRVFKADITTVKVPFYFDEPTGEVKADGTPATTRTLQYLHVICSNKYSVAKDAVLGMRKDLGDAFGKLFVVESSKTLKPNAEELFKSILGELGLDEAAVAKSMEVLFDTNETVTTTDDYEKEHAKLEENVRLVLDQSVVRQNPGLKY
jgi:hypothetical protein